LQEDYVQAACAAQEREGTMKFVAFAAYGVVDDKYDKYDKTTTRASCMVSAHNARLRKMILT
jgi:hypothetical protein